MAFIQCEHCGHRIEVKDFVVVNACPACGRSVEGEFLARGRFAFSLTTAICVVLATGAVMLVNIRVETVNADPTEMKELDAPNGTSVREAHHSDGVGTAYGWPYPITGDSAFPAACTDVVLGLVFILAVGWCSEQVVRRSRGGPPTPSSSP